MQLRPFLDALAFGVGATLDDHEWLAIDQTLFHSGETGRENSYRCKLAGQGGKADLTLLYEPGSSVVSFELKGSPDAAAQARVLVYLTQAYELSPS